MHANWAFADFVQDFGPENFSTLQRCVKEEIRAPSMPVVLALLRLSRCDADVYYKFRQTLLDKVMYSSPSDNALSDLAQDISGVRLPAFNPFALVDRIDVCAAYCDWQVSASYYALSPRKDVCFELGRLLMSLKVRCAARPVVTSQQPSVATSVMSTECHPSQRHGEACQFFESSNAFCGEHHVTWHNLGICCFYVDNLPAALDCFSRVRHIRFRARARGVRFSLRPCVRQSMELDPHYADARTWYRKVRARLWRSQHPPSSP